MGEQNDTTKQEPGKSGPALIVAVDDMFFAAKIRGTAAALGRELVQASSAEKVREALERHPNSVLILDLNSERLDPISTIEFVKKSAELNGVRVVGFLSHVQVDLKVRAEQAGCDTVIPRSVFSSRLPEFLSDGFGRAVGRSPDES